MPIAEPISRSLQELAERIADLFAKERPFPQDRLNEEELEALVEMGVEEGVLAAGEKEMIQEIIKLGDKTVKDCMTPRVDAFALPDTLSNEEVIAQVRVKRHGRVPVYGDSPDEILGILDVKGSSSITMSITPNAWRLLLLFRKRCGRLICCRGFLTHTQRLAIVVDEFGGTEGVVTFNDIVEEVIGDAVPRGDEALYIEETRKWKVVGQWQCQAGRFGRVGGRQLEREGLDTIGGLIFNQLGYLPKPGTIVEIPPLRLEIRQSSRKRVLEVAVEKMKDFSAELAHDVVSIGFLSGRLVSCLRDRSRHPFSASLASAPVGAPERPRCGSASAALRTTRPVADHGSGDHQPSEYCRLGAAR